MSIRTMIDWRADEGATVPFTDHRQRASYFGRASYRRRSVTCATPSPPSRDGYRLGKLESALGCLLEGIWVLVGREFHPKKPWSILYPVIQRDGNLGHTIDCAAAPNSSAGAWRNGHIHRYLPRGRATLGGRRSRAWKEVERLPAHDGTNLSPLSSLQVGTERQTSSIG